MNLRKKFSEADLDRIKNAVKQAESKISGEIVPVIVERSGVYAIANYRAAIAVALTAFTTIVIFDRYVPELAIYDPLTIFIIVLISGFFGGLLSHFFDPLKRFMLSQQHMDKSTRLKAESYFLQEEVFNTQQRTGIMLFISFFEHEVIVMADKGISKVVEQREWDNLVNGLIAKIKAGRTAEGLEAAILRCGEILLEKNFVIATNDINELKDDLRID
jgi:putative membrane protein